MFFISCKNDKIYLLLFTFFKKQWMKYQRKANGKILLTSEYFILDGAKGIALPTKLGQTLSVNENKSFQYEAYLNDDTLWFRYDPKNNENESILLLNKALDYIVKNNENQDINALKGAFKTRLEFDKNWGLGSSSTFVALLSDYFNFDAFDLNRYLFKGSGYDIACAFAASPLIYQRDDEVHQSFQEIQFNEKVTNCLYFVYLNKKQNSRNAINYYKSINSISKKELINDLNQITEHLQINSNVSDWIYLLKNHEALISKSLKLDKVSIVLGNKMPFFTKSLGAWGGDFILCISEETEDEVKSKFNQIGYNNIFSYNDFIL
jgi:mevalonate kinase